MTGSPDPETDRSDVPFGRDKPRLESGRVVRQENGQYEVPLERIPISRRHAPVARTDY